MSVQVLARTHEAQQTVKSHHSGPSQEVYNDDEAVLEKLANSHSMLADRELGLES